MRTKERKVERESGKRGQAKVGKKVRRKKMKNVIKLDRRRVRNRLKECRKKKTKQ